MFEIFFRPEPDRITPSSELAIELLQTRLAPCFFNTRSELNPVMLSCLAGNRRITPSLWQG